MFLAGGYDFSLAQLLSAELYDPVAATFATAGNISTGRQQTLASASWTSSDPTIATVTSDSTNSGSIYGVAAGTATVSACAGSICGSTTITVPSSQLTGITIAPANSAVVRGASLAFFATGSFSDGSTQDLTAFVTWSSSAPSLASINATGIATGIATGTASITASYGGSTASANLLVVPPISSIAISPQNASFSPGASQQFMATARYTDGTSGDVTNIVQWSSQTPLVATVSAGGSMTAVSAGTTIISATAGSVTGSSTLTVAFATPTIANVSPATGTTGTQVTISGSGFGNSQGRGSVWLGTSPAVVVSWSDTQVIATVAPGSSTGSAQIQQNGASSNSVPFAVIGPNITDFSPSAGPAGTQVTIDGSGFGATPGQVLLGTAPGIVSSWSDTEVVATVAPGSTSGPVEILQNGIWSNQFAFTVTGAPPHIAGITPNSGAAGTVISIRGAGFGAAQENGVVWIGGPAGSVLQWTDSLVVATVGSNAVSGVVKIQQNGVWSNAVGFKINGPTPGFAGSMTLSPSVLSMVVGDTRSLQPLDSNNQSVTGLTWSSSNTTIVSLSTDNPPVLTALAPGTVTITAGGASSDVTVYAGPTLPLGTTIWSDLGDGSGVSSIMPAVPSETGVADVFAVNNSGSVQAIQTDGTVAWTASTPVSDFPIYLPDFQGGMIVYDGVQSMITRFDGMTGQPNVLYSPGITTGLGVPAVHTDGIIFIPEFTDAQTYLTGIDSSAGGAKFKIPIPNWRFNGTESGQVCSGNGVNLGSGTPETNSPLPDPIIAGDGFAYVTYTNVSRKGNSQDAQQPYPLAIYALNKQLGDDVFNQSQNNLMSSAAVLADIAAMESLVNLPECIAVPNSPHCSRFFHARLDLDGLEGIETSTGDAQQPQKAAEYFNGVIAPLFKPICNSSETETDEYHLLKVGSDGSSTDILVNQSQTTTTLVYGRTLETDPDNGFWTYTQTVSKTAGRGGRIITNADQGVLMVGGEGIGPYCAVQTDQGCTSNVEGWSKAHLTTYPGGSDVTVPDMLENFTPVLQLQDGSFVGSQIVGLGPGDPGTAEMVRFDLGGNILGFALGYLPQIATADGGVIAVPYNNLNELGGALLTGSAGTFDTNLNTTGITNLPTYSWLNTAYSEPQGITASMSEGIHYASVFNAVAGGNRSQNGAATQEEWFPELPSCPLVPPGQAPCAREAIRSALGSLREALGGSCPNCSKYVFNILGSTQQQFYRYLLRAPRLFDGTRSNAPTSVLCPSGFFNWVFCPVGAGQTVAEFMKGPPKSDAISQTPSEPKEGPMIFIDPSVICRTVDGGPKQVLNEALLFHESLHGYFGIYDRGLIGPSLLQSLLGDQTLPSTDVTYYLEANVLGGGAAACGD